MLALCTTQVIKRVKRKKKKNKVTKNLLQGDLNPDPPNQLELKVNASYPLDHLDKRLHFKFKRGIYSFSMVIVTFQG